MQDNPTSMKYRSLINSLAAMKHIAVAFSGGVDSALLLRAACDAIGPDNVVALRATSPSQATAEADQARLVAETLGIQLQGIPTDELTIPEYKNNGPRRCYYCKRRLFSKLKTKADIMGAVLVEGTNADDVGQHRPGLQALREAKIQSPLLTAGLSKSEVRSLARAMALPVWNNPAQACLASRIPTGHPITVAALQRIETAEAAVRALGFNIVRIRDWGLLAVLEVGQDELDKVFAALHRSKIYEAIRTAGYHHVSVDLQGYRSGSVS